jgi:hypothetical protein
VRSIRAAWDDPHPLVSLSVAVLYPDATAVRTRQQRYTCEEQYIPVLKRLVEHLRARWPQLRIALQADSYFAVPALYAYCEEQYIPYTIGLVSNERLEALAAPLAEQAKQQRAQTGEKMRLLAAGPYQAGSWTHERRVVYKAEALEQGLNTRFVLTTRSDPPEELYTWDTRRGNRPELCIKDLKEGCFADRLSCQSFWANQFGLLLHSAVSWLLDTIRR